MPGREAAEIQAHAGIFSSDLGDQASNRADRRRSHMRRRSAGLLLILCSSPTKRASARIEAWIVAASAGVAGRMRRSMRHAYRPSSALYAPPSVLPDISPAGGRSAGSSACRHSPDGEWRKQCGQPISPLWGRCPAGRGGNVGHRLMREPLSHSPADRARAPAAAIASPRIDTISPTCSRVTISGGQTMTQSPCTPPRHAAEIDDQAALIGEVEHALADLHLGRQLFHGHGVGDELQRRSAGPCRARRR